MEIIPPADDLSSFFAILPTQVSEAVEKDTNGLYEIVLDLGRRPEARYLDKHTNYFLNCRFPNKIWSMQSSGSGQFSGDNRAGIERTLHRISAIEKSIRQNHRAYLPSRTRRLRNDQCDQRSCRIRKINFISWTTRRR